MNVKNDLLEMDGHLNDAGIALYAESLKLNVISQLPDIVRKHVKNCDQCKKRALRLASVIWNKKKINLSKHPYLVNYNAAGIPKSKKELALLAQLEKKYASLENKDYEHYLKREIVFRNNTLPVQLLYPNNIETCEKTLPFKFNSPIVHSLNLELETPDEQVLYESFLPKGTTKHLIPLHENTQLTPGLYYWSLFDHYGNSIIGKVYLV